jgi:predicted PurR-regulated permease PerM
VVGVVVLAVLYFAQAICIPFAMAVFLAFLLAPPVETLQRFGLGRVPSVLVVVLAAVLALGLVIWVVSVQARSLVNEGPNYTENIQAKLDALRHLALPGRRLVEKMLHQITGGMGGGAREVADNTQNTLSKPMAIVVQPEAWLTGLPAFLARLAEALGSLVLVLVLLVFMLLKREDLRNRLIRLVGDGRITATTKALDEASQRISRYLLMQLIVNGTFG